jgi:WD40 repeat protein
MDEMERLPQTAKDRRAFSTAIGAVLSLEKREHWDEARLEFGWKEKEQPAHKTQQPVRASLQDLDIGPMRIIAAFLAGEWALVQQLLNGHSSLITSCCLSPCGKLVLSGLTINTSLFAHKTRLVLLSVLDSHRHLRTPTPASHAYSFFRQYNSPCPFLDSGSQDASICLWNASTGQKRKTRDMAHRVRNPERNPEQKAYVTDVCFAPSGEFVLSASVDKTMKLWVTATGRLQRTIVTPLPVVSCRFSPCGTTILSGATDGSLSRYAVTSGRLLGVLAGDPDRLKSLCAVFSPDGDTILAASFNATMERWSAVSGEVQETLRGHFKWTVVDKVRSLYFSPDTLLVLSTSMSLCGERTLKLWETQTGERKHTLILSGFSSGTVFSWIRNICFSPDSNTVCFPPDGRGAGTVQLWDATTGTLGPKLENSPLGVVNRDALLNPGVCACCISGGLILGGLRDGSLAMWSR